MVEKIKVPYKCTNEKCKHASRITISDGNVTRCEKCLHESLLMQEDENEVIINKPANNNNNSGSKIIIIIC